MNEVQKAIERFRKRRALRLDSRGAIIIRLDKKFVEEEHPRGEGGKFKTKGAAEGTKQSNEEVGKRAVSRLPKLHKGCNWGPTAALAGKEAARDGFGKAFEKAAKNVKRNEIVIQKDSNGKEFASVPGLAARADNKVKFKDNPPKK